MSLRKVTLVVLVGFILGATTRVATQGVRWWRAAEMGVYDVTVGDVGAVCLYVVGIRNMVTPPSVWGLQKSQLPEGKGCQ